MPVDFKKDAGKPPLSLISRTALDAEARVMAFGAKKYSRNGWREVALAKPSEATWGRLVDAALRHIYSWADGEDLDPETGESHLANARCCLAFLIEFQAKSMGTDDRFKASAASKPKDCRNVRGGRTCLREVGHPGQHTDGPVVWDANCLNCKHLLETHAQDGHPGCTVPGCGCGTKY